MTKKNSFIKSMRLFSLLTVLCISVTILGFELLLHLKDYSDRRRELTETFYKDKQYVLQSEINRIITRHSFQNKQIQISIDKEVKSRSREAYQLLDSFYQINRDRLSDKEMKGEIIEILRSLAYREEYGYFYAFDAMGITLLNRANPAVEGESAIDVQDGRGRYFIRDMIDLALTEGEGEYSYLWFREDGEHIKNLVKTGYIMHFDPLDIIFGTSIFEEDLRGDLQNSMILSMEYVFADNPDYIFVYSWDGRLLNSGDREKQHIAEPDEIFPEMRRTADRGGGFMTYPSPEDGNISYLAYVTKVKEWDWIIGARITTEELEEGIGALENKLRLTLRDEFIRMAALTIALGVIVYIIINRFNRSLLRDLSLYSRFFQKAAPNNALIDREKLHYHEFFVLSGFVNKMIRDKINIEEERQKMRNLESLGYLSAGIAHDFKNCLTGIYGYIELAQASIDDPGETKTYLGYSLETMERARSLADRLLTFSRSGSPQLEKLSLNSLLDKALEPMKISDSICLDLPDWEETFYIGGEKRQLSLMLDMILTNSREAMPESKGTITITMEREILRDEFPCHLEGSYIRMDITDDGKGIAKENLKKIFDPYFTTKQIGCGMGLSTAFGIIHQHKGHVEARQAPGGGTTMSLYFPESTDPIGADSGDPG